MNSAEGSAISQLMSAQRVMRCLAVVSVLALNAAPVTAGPIVSIEPPGISVGVGQLFSVDINVNDVNQLVAFAFDLTFTPGIVRAEQALEGTFLSGAGPTYFFPGVIDNMSGRINLTAGIVRSFSGVSGSGLLARIVFTALAEGTADFGLPDLWLWDSKGHPITAGTADDSIGVTSQAAVPELTTLALTLIGSLTVAAAKRRRSSPPR